MEKTKIDCMYLKRFQPEVNVDMSTVQLKNLKIVDQTPAYY